MLKLIQYKTYNIIEHKNFNWIFIKNNCLQLTIIKFFRKIRYNNLKRFYNNY